MNCKPIFYMILTASVMASPSAPAQKHAGDHPATVLHASRLLDIDAGSIVSPGEVLIEGERIVAAGSSVEHPAGAEVIDLGDVTLMPGLIDAHVHLFLHPGAEDLQTVKESVPQRTIMAALAARVDLMAGFTAERDMGTEGAGSADTAVRNAIDEGLIPGPGCASAATPSIFSAGTRMRTTLIPLSTCSRTPRTPIMSTRSSR